MSSYVLFNRSTKQFAARGCQGQHDGKFSQDIGDAFEFPTFGECADFGQNFDDSWQPMATHLPAPQVDCDDAIAAALDEQTGGR